MGAFIFIVIGVMVGIVFCFRFISARTAQLPFLYSQATNAQYGAHAMEAIFAIEGVTSNLLSAARSVRRLPACSA